ncbi:DUF3592 domain-containing protein [Corallococcus interemptor]|uniref:DUF3592 domain-containing protein n=1 Tax=Corallococcus interemptor TaxID=2316720 RepID=A0A3A8R6H0_9BACT|nr:DUF3592 domain-containing protein [Corallococcus interemptor]RKH72832.1 DUF3592 domain-containing protein [Corallococcus interemptor]
MHSLNVILFTVFFVLAPLGVMVLLVRQHRLTLALRERGRLARGKVVHIRESWMKRNVFVVEYVFRPPGRPEIRGEYKVHKDRLPSQSVFEGIPVEVRYLPEDPHRHQCSEVEVERHTVMAGIFGLVVLMAVAFARVFYAP